MRALLATLAAVTLLAACGGDVDTNTPRVDGRDATGGTNPACDPQLDEAFAAWAEAGFSGSIAILTGGEPDCLAGYGLADRDAERPNTADTVFGIGSVSKAFTAAAILHLVDEGKLALDDRAGDLVADLEGPVADATVEQLMLHTSGLTGSHGVDHEPLDRDAAVAAIGGLEQASPPGTDYQYSNAGYTLLALIVEEVSGTTYREYMVAEILQLPDGDTAGGFWDGEPAAPGPRAVGYLDDGPTDQMGDAAGPHWALSGNGDLAMTMPQLAAWARALFTGETLSPESTEVVATPGFEQDDGTAESPGWGVLDPELLGEPAYGSAGGGGDLGHDAVVLWLPESDRAIAMASNTEELSAEDLLQAVGPALVAGDPLPRPDASSGEVDPAELEAVAGTYELASGGSYEVTPTDEGLEVAARGAEAVAALFPPTGDFTADDVRAHEQDVLALFRGDTQEGREERAALEEDLGPIDGIELGGTVVADRELHTYVTVTSGDESFDLWYALSEDGGIEAVEITEQPPSLLVVPGDDGGYRPADPTGAGPDVTVTFTEGDDPVMTITGPDASTEARLAS